MLPSTLEPGPRMREESHAHPPEYLDSLANMLIDSLMPSRESEGRTKQHENIDAFGRRALTTLGVASVTECDAS